LILFHNFVKLSHRRNRESEWDIPLTKLGLRQPASYEIDQPRASRLPLLTYSGVRIGDLLRHAFAGEQASEG
jgi:hypothetical protein